MTSPVSGCMNILGALRPPQIMCRDLQEDVRWYWSAMEKPLFDELNSLVVMQNGLAPATIIYLHIFCMLQSSLYIDHAVRGMQPEARKGQFTSVYARSMGVRAAAGCATGAVREMQWGLNACLQPRGRQSCTEGSRGKGRFRCCCA